jgi:hypothetical protein
VGAQNEQFWSTTCQPTYILYPFPIRYLHIFNTNIQFGLPEIILYNIHVNSIKVSQIDGVKNCCRTTGTVPTLQDFTQMRSTLKKPNSPKKNQRTTVFWVNSLPTRISLYEKNVRLISLSTLFKAWFVTENYGTLRPVINPQDRTCDRILSLNWTAFGTFPWHNSRPRLSADRKFRRTRTDGRSRRDSRPAGWSTDVGDVCGRRVRSPGTRPAGPALPRGKQRTEREIRGTARTTMLPRPYSR